MPVCQKLNYLYISKSKLRTFDLGLTPNLETLSLLKCTDFEELHVSLACPNLKFLELRNLGLRSLDLELIPNLERLDLVECHELVEINAPVGCLKKLGYLNLSSCLRFTNFEFGYVRKLFGMDEVEVDANEVDAPGVMDISANRLQREVTEGSYRYGLEVDAPGVMNEGSEKRDLFLEDIGSMVNEVGADTVAKPSSQEVVLREMIGLGAL
nr:disease resistance protein (TIR-NBS-LRR class) family [Tanacetum cinerariifolium]